MSLILSHSVINIKRSQFTNVFVPFRCSAKVNILNHKQETRLDKHFLCLKKFYVTDNFAKYHNFLRVLSYECVDSFQVLLALPMTIRLGWIGLLETNTVAYYKHYLSLKKVLCY
jgi:hypothetical protein